MQKGVPRILQNSQENTCAGVPLLMKRTSRLQLHLRKTASQVLSYEFCKNFQSTFFEEHIPTAASFI